MDATNNITLRKKRNYNSCDDLSCTKDDFSVELSSQDSHSSSTKSLPNASTDNEEIRQLKYRIEQLTYELDGAHGEIENLMLENSELKNHLTQCRKTIEIYKQIGVSEKIYKTPINLNPQASSSLKRKRSKSQHYTNRTSNSKIIKNTTETICAKKLNYEENAEDNITKNDPTEEKYEYIHLQNQESNKNHKVLIISDQPNSDIQKILQTLLGNKYDVFCFSKPGANMKNLTLTLLKEVKLLTKNDFIILKGGMYDSKPNELKTNLHNWLQYTQNTNVIVCETPYNKNLNEKKLNYEIRYICKTNNTLFMDMGYEFLIPSRKNHSKYICQMLLKEILHIGYKIEFENYNKKQIARQLNKRFTIQKEKITYYFKSLKTDIKDHGMNEPEGNNLFRSQN